MDMDKPVGQRRSRVSDFVAVVALLVVAGGYFIYQHARSTDASAALAQQSASPAPGTEGGAGANSNSSWQHLATNTRMNGDKDTSPSASQSGQTRSASLSTGDVAYVQKRRANIRAEASSQGPLIGRAYKGTKLSVVSRNGKWVQIESGETKGWVSAHLLGVRQP
jgi:uncharacterized protein YgiM (DUF1202 family)